MSKLEPAAAPHTYEVLDRAQLVLPSWYLPLSEGAVIAGESILRAAGYSGIQSPSRMDQNKSSHLPATFRS